MKNPGMVPVHFSTAVHSVQHCTHVKQRRSQNGGVISVNAYSHDAAETRCGSRIWSRGAPAFQAESYRHSKVESSERSKHSAAGVQGPLKDPGSFWLFDAQICILTHSRDSFSLIFDIYFDTKFETF